MTPAALRAVRKALDGAIDVIVADAGYSNGEHISHTQATEVEVALPSNRAVNTQGGGNHFQKSDFTYLADEDANQCPAGTYLPHKTVNRKNRMRPLRLQSKPPSIQMHQRWGGGRQIDEAALDNADRAATAEQGAIYLLGINRRQ